MQKYKLSDHLKQQMREIKNKRSAKYTTLSLLAGAAKLSEKEAHTEIRIPQLCKLCDISRATYYLHFTGKDELMAKLMEHLIELESDLSPIHDETHSVADTVRQIVDWYITLHISNENLFLNLSILRWSDPRINDLWLVRAQRLHAISYGLLSNHKEFRDLDEDYSQYVIEFVGSGMNTVVSRFASDNEKNPFVPAKAKALREFTADLLYRSLFGEGIADAGSSKKKIPGTQ